MLTSKLKAAKIKKVTIDFPSEYGKRVLQCGGRKIIDLFTACPYSSLFPTHLSPIDLIHVVTSREIHSQYR